MKIDYSIAISTISLCVATLGYFNPRKPGGTVQWTIEKEPNSHYAEIKHVGSGRARNLVITPDGAIPSDVVEKDVSYPHESFKVLAIHTIGGKQPTVTISWRNILRIRQTRHLDL